MLVIDLPNRVHSAEPFQLVSPQITTDDPPSVYPVLQDNIAVLPKVVPDVMFATPFWGEGSPQSMKQLISPL